MSEPAPADRATPYKFLDSFMEEDAARFYGRERDTAEVIARIAKEQTCVLYGPSGTGKTSLLRAGVMVSLAARGYRTVYARVLGSPLEDVVAAAAQALKVSADSTSFGTREAIARPLLDAGVDYSQKFLDELVDLLSLRGFDPVELQIVCTEIYREAVRRDGDPPSLDEADLRAVGGLDEIYRRYLDEATSRIEGSQVMLARSVLDALITADRTKRALTAPRLVLDATFSARPDEVEALLERFTESRILRAERRAGEVWYEILHDRLVPHVLAWLNVDRDFFEFRSARAMIESLSRSGLFRDKPGMLLSREQLDIISPFKERLRLDQVELEFALRSAIVSGSRDAPFWAEAFGRGAAKAVLLHLSKSEREDARISAARALEVFAGDELTSRGIEAALHDPSENVRRAAGLALGRRLRPEELPTIWARFNDAAREAPAERLFDALADLLQAGLNLAPFSRRDFFVGALTKRFDRTKLSSSALRRAMAIVDKRLEAANAHVMNARMSLSTTQALLAVGAWYVLAGSWLTLAVTLLFARPGAFNLLAMWVGDGVVVMAYAALCGGMMARYAGRRAVLSHARTGDEDWLRSILDPRAIALPGVPLFLFLWIANSQSWVNSLDSLPDNLLHAVIISAPRRGARAP